MSKRWCIGVLAVLAIGAFSSDAMAAARPELGVIAAGLRVPGGALWLVGPMVFGVAGAITLGWRRASSEARSGLNDD
ncbi:MAG: hypothetical protein OEU54_06890 [Gemmatimonadota bacterium]|nr:hypothetical protein [Gemmatimonadota bacterium]